MEESKLLSGTDYCNKLLAKLVLGMRKESFDITKETKDLKEVLSLYKTDIFLGDLSTMLLYPQKLVSQGLKSPLRELMYIANLHLTSTPVKTELERPQYSQNEWEDIVERIKSIQQWYIENIIPRNFNENAEDIEKRMISGQSFFNYFNQGPLNYEEQVIEKILQYFTPFNEFIISEFGLSVEELLLITDWITKLPNRFIANTLSPSDGEIKYSEFALEMKKKGVISPNWKDHMPERLKQQFQFIYDKGKMNTFSKQELIEIFGEKNAEAYLNNFVLERQAEDFLFYTQSNNLALRSILIRGDGDFQFFNRELIHHNLYNSLVQKITNNEKMRERFFKVRGKILEDKIVEIFKDYFGANLEYYKGYYTTKGNEQDLIIFHKDMALIVEVKSSKLQEPRRDPFKAYDIIKANFKEVIDKGYEQSFRVKEFFIDRINFDIFSDIKLKNCLKTVYPRSYPKCFSLIVTLERFGGIQSDLSQLLDLYDDDKYPWCVNVDDLETFLLVLKKHKNKKKNITLKDFLYLRQRLHGRILADDELDICGAFLTKKLTMKTVPRGSKKFLPPLFTDIFDEHYHGKGGMGFKDERDMDLKNDDNKIVLNK